MRVQTGVAAVAVDLRAEMVRLTRKPGANVGEDARLRLRNCLFRLRSPHFMKRIRGLRISVSCIVRGHEMPLEVNVIFVHSQFRLSLQQMFPAEVNTRHITTELVTG